LRALRTITLFKLSRYWKSFGVLLENLYDTLQNVKIFAILMIIVLYIYVLLGLSFFANKSKIDHLTLAIDSEHGHSPMFHFDDLMQAIFTTFVVLTNDT
jgi:hypothetical protein